MSTLEVRLAADQLDALADRIAARMGQPQIDRWLTSDQAAAYLGCPRGRIHDLVARGDLQVRRDGRRLLFRQAWLDACVGGG